MQVNFKNIQRPTLFQEFFDKLIIYSNDVINYIKINNNSSVTPTLRNFAKTSINNIKKSLKFKNNIDDFNKYRIAKDKDNLDVDCCFARGLTWSDDTIDDAYLSYKKRFPSCVIVKVNNPRSHITTCRA